MKTPGTMLGISLVLMLAALSPAFALQPPQGQGTVVGHLTHVEGNLLRYVHDEEDWVHMVKDSPVGTEDLLLCEGDSKAEIIIPNNTWIRTGDNTKIHIVKLEDDTTELDMDSGLARFYNKSTAATIHVTTLFGSVLAPPLTSFDMYQQADSIHITALEGTVTFNYLRDNSNHDVAAGSASLRAGFENVSAGEEVIDVAWNEWNREMDQQWEARLQGDGDEHQYLPETIRHESYTLRDNGIWETVYYEGRNCSFWRPLHVPSYWSPYTVGRWTAWYGDQCWIPYEPFGYVTHHYGNWVYIDSCSRWYWAPPDCHRRHRDVYFLVIPFAWYPGRVSWIHRGDYVGWIPLAPFEPYYCYRSWGPLSRVVAKDPRHHHKDLDIKHCRYKNHAVIVKKSNLYRVTNYRSERIRNRADAFIDNFRRTAGINSRIFNNFKTMKQRFAFDTRAAKKILQPAAVKPTVRRKSADTVFAGTKSTMRKTAALPARSKTSTPSVRTLPVRTKKSSAIQTIRGTKLSTFKPIQRYKPEIKTPEVTPKVRVAPEQKHRIGIPGGEKRQVLPNINRQRPATSAGVTLQNRATSRVPNMQRHQITPRLKIHRPALYANQGTVSRSHPAPQSAGFGRR